MSVRTLLGNFDQLGPAYMIDPWHYSFLSYFLFLLLVVSMVHASHKPSFAIAGLSFLIDVHSKVAMTSLSESFPPERCLLNEHDLVGEKRSP
jgi:hypothetical protein